MSWFTRLIETPKNILKSNDSGSPEGLWVKCPNCSEALYNKELTRNAMVCSKCNQHLRMSALQRAELLFDAEGFEEVKYPTSFDISALEDELDSYLSIMERNFSPRFNKTLQKNIVRKTIPTTPQVIRTEIEDEIEAGDGIVNPVNANRNFFDEGDGNPNSNLDKTFKGSKQATDEERTHRKE